jgi:hypothetical protein
MGQAGSWIWKSLLISAILALLTWISFYFFFKIHQELNIQPGFALPLSGLAFLLSAIITMIYFHIRRTR